jgi:hypothetical protein
MINQGINNPINNINLEAKHNVTPSHRAHHDWMNEGH